ncbi:MAG: class I SAM-dependent methyltransferase [Candidatus Sungbacteria bacterium]|uniref:Class I SAM-dependent methyltransferase n=1 Tax=Candidatus Sungiibacteriota bacterium TaxID=2750080 RepID=A0A931WNG0_9BACT|nr:class I SAM-dependent methyltransferase [Candidatus Sungbacteria bacterium]
MKCFLCSREGAVEFLHLGDQPLANKYPRAKEEFETEDFFPLAVFFCSRCKNVQLGTIVSRSRMFEDYYYLSSVNPGLVRHFEEFANKIAKARFVVDIGSNDGILLKPLKERGVKTIGVDPSINVSKIANDAGLTTIVSFFDSAAVGKIKKQYESPDVVVASSIFTHLEDPHQFIEDVKELMADDGEFIIEVEYIGNILENTQFERFYLDRVFYYSLTSLKHLLEAHGMYVADVEKIEPHGGSIRVVTRKKGRGPAPADSVARFVRKEEESLNLPKLDEFKRNVDAQISAFRHKLEEYKRSNLKVAGYGAPARVATICNYGNIGPSLIEFIVDDSPLKQNRFSPGTHIPIVPKDYLEEHKPDVLVVFAYEYFDDIKEKTRGAYKYLLPIPPREIV